jgi:isopentenyl diphosphate isomerase/L-lactate dehydrogenase-like FMN-dependent dehydrogenase
VARALGARAVLVGRPYLYGLGAAGERGVGWVLDQLLAGAERTMALVGAASLDDLSRDLVRR